MPWHGFNKESLLNIFEEGSKKISEQELRDKQKLRQTFEKEDMKYYSKLYKMKNGQRRKQNLKQLNVKVNVPKWSFEYSDACNMVPVESENTTQNDLNCT